MSNTWKVFGNLEYTNFVFPATANTVFVVYDTIANRYFFSISDLYVANGHSRNNATKSVRNEVYSKYYTPISFNMFPEHVFIRMSELSSFLQRYFSASGISGKQKDSFKKNAIYLTQNIVSNHSNGKKIKEDDYSFYCLSSIFTGESSISFTYINGKMMLHVRDMIEAMGYSRDAGLSKPLTELSESHTVFGNPARYIAISKLPIFATKSQNRKAVMSIYHLASEVSKNTAERYENKLVFNKEKTVAFYNNEHTINIINIDGDVAYRVSDVSKSIGLKDGSKGLRKFSSEVDNIFYATRKNIQDFLNKSTMTKSIKSKWNSFLKISA